MLLLFGFRQKYSASHALINIAENIIKALDDGNIGCGVSNCNQYVLINGYDSSLLGINCSVPQDLF